MIHVEGSAGRIGSHDHACLFHRSTEERVRASAAFVKRSLADNARVLLVTDNRPEREALAELEGAGVEVRAALDSGRLVLSDIRETYLAGGDLDPDRMLELLDAEISRAAADGIGFRVAGEVDVFPPEASVEAWYDYERRVDRIFSDRGAAALCIYNSRHFEPSTCDDMAELHPLVLAEPGEMAESWERCLVARNGGGALAIAGEVDLANSESFARSLEAEAARREVVRLDLHDLEFIDLSGLRAIERVGAGLSGSGGHIAIDSAGYVLRQLLETLELTDEPWLRLHER